MDGEYIGGDGSEGERGNVKFLGLRRSCLPPATLHRRSLPKCLAVLRGQRLPAKAKHEAAHPQTNTPTVLCRFLGSMPVCTTASAEIAKIANSDIGHCHPFPLSSNLKFTSRAVLPT